MLRAYKPAEFAAAQRAARDRAAASGLPGDATPLRSPRLDRLLGQVQVRVGGPLRSDLHVAMLTRAWASSADGWI